ncbi:hypothetical protein [Streptomyces tauricus]|uniref:hypothetical protein n=1 Tax=Streptomyces tauricus TaxID=68274 RepID=UPI0038121B52
MDGSHIRALIEGSKTGRTEYGSGLGATRCAVERAFADLHWFRRLRIRWEIRDDIYEAFLSLACSLVYWRRLQSLLTS